ncbi:class I SAM-dependent methyltransferase [Abyssibius alkaniclasticus]|uniref:class I SAM-dependent methyltransferase n=1 Tax=Abyssibius alkaniclasticus TaxID=2881234 RepID=UPI0040592079
MSDISHLSRRYDRAANRWQAKMDRFGFGPAYRHMLGQVALPARPLVALDAGTGCGTFAGAALDFGLSFAQLDLLDPSARMLAHASEMVGARAPLRCFATDIASHEPAACYDLILCAHVVEHCADPVATLAQLRAMLAPGGTLLLAVSKPHWCSLIVFLRWRHRCFEPAEMRGLLARAGFETTRGHPFPSGVPSRVSHGYCAN